MLREGEFPNRLASGPMKESHNQAWPLVKDDPTINEWLLSLFTIAREFISKPKETFDLSL